MKRALLALIFALAIPLAVKAQGIFAPILGAAPPACVTPIALVSGQTAGTFNTASIVLPNNPTAGNFVVASIMVEYISPGVGVTVQDANGNSYTPTPKSPAFGTGYFANWIFYLPNAPANASKTITMSFAGSITPWYSGINVGEFSGLALSETLDKDAAYLAEGVSSTNIDLPVIAPYSNGELLVGATYRDSSVNAPWTLLGPPNFSGNEYLIQTQKAPQAIGFTQGSATTWTGIAAAFRCHHGTGT